PVGEVAGAERHEVPRGCRGHTAHHTTERPPAPPSVTGSGRGPRPRSRLDGAAQARSTGWVEQKFDSRVARWPAGEASVPGAHRCAVRLRAGGATSGEQHGGARGG